MADLFEEADDATLLTTDERLGLLPSHITYRAELNAAEQENILRGQEWAFAQSREVLDEKFIRNLHKRMFGDVWRWAGRYRTSEKTIGIRFYEVPAAVRQLLEDARAWITHKAYSPDEIAIRFSHRLVQIHPFANGNGRLSRLLADLLVMHLGGERFTWGRANLQEAGILRRSYIEAVKAADQHDFGPLIAFARS